MNLNTGFSSVCPGKPVQSDSKANAFSRAQLSGHPEATTDDQPGEGILDGHDTLSPFIPADTPGESLDGDERR